MELKILYEDENLLAIDKPASIVVFPENRNRRKTLIDLLLEKFPSLSQVGEPPRYGIVHRLDKDTSGVLLVAKNNQTLNFLQKQFKQRKVIKKYLVLVIGKVKINKGKIDTLMGRALKDRTKQKVYLPHNPKAPKKGLRRAITEYRTVKKFKYYTLLEVFPKTGRKHQIRCHLSYLSHPIAGDKTYGFKNQPKPKNLHRQFLHANFLKIKLPDKKEQEIKSNLSKELKKILEELD